MVQVYIIKNIQAQFVYGVAGKVQNSGTKTIFKVKLEYSVTAEHHQHTSPSPDDDDNNNNEKKDFENCEFNNIKENCALPGYYAAFLPIFWDNLSVPSPGVKNPKET
jgi:hypothetical protein